MHPVQVIQPGFYTTVQDGGRKGYRRWGVPISGPMDHLNFTLANSLLGNPRKRPYWNAPFMALHYCLMHQAAWWLLVHPSSYFAMVNPCPCITR